MNSAYVIKIQTHFTRKRLIQKHKSILGLGGLAVVLMPGQ